MTNPKYFRAKWTFYKAMEALEKWPYTSSRVPNWLLFLLVWSWVWYALLTGEFGVKP